MRQNVRRQLRVLRAYAVVNSLVLIVLATGAFRQATQKFDEITTQRMNVVDADGTLRMVSACRRASRRAAAGFSGRIPRLKGLSLREILFRHSIRAARLVILLSQFGNHRQPLSRPCSEFRRLSRVARRFLYAET